MDSNTDGSRREAESDGSNALIAQVMKSDSRDATFQAPADACKYGLPGLQIDAKKKDDPRYDPNHFEVDGGIRRAWEAELASRPFKFTDSKEGHEIRFRSGHTIMIKGSEVEVRNPDGQAMSPQNGSYNLGSGIKVSVEAPRTENGRRINGEVKIDYAGNRTFRVNY